MSQMPAQGGPPPGLLALLQGAGGAQPPQQAPQSGGGDERQAIQLLKQMIQLGNQYIQVEPDAADKATMAKVLGTLHQYLAAEQKDAETALGGGPATRVMRKLGQ